MECNINRKKGSLLKDKNKCYMYSFAEQKFEEN